jgi:hypothetical protein
MEDKIKEEYIVEIVDQTNATEYHAGKIRTYLNRITQQARLEALKSILQQWKDGDLRESNFENRLNYLINQTK